MAELEPKQMPKPPLWVRKSDLLIFVKKKIICQSLNLDFPNDEQQF